MLKIILWTTQDNFDVGSRMGFSVSDIFQIYRLVSVMDTYARILNNS